MDLNGRECTGTGIYLNPWNEQFAVSVNSELYVDKTELIKYTNSREFYSTQQMM